MRAIKKKEDGLHHLLATDRSVFTNEHVLISLEHSARPNNTETISKLIIECSHNFYLSFLFLIIVYHSSIELQYWNIAQILGIDLVYFYTKIYLTKSIKPCYNKNLARSEASARHSKIKARFFTLLLFFLFKSFKDFNDVIYIIGIANPFIAIRFFIIEKNTISASAFGCSVRYDRDFIPTD